MRLILRSTTALTTILFSATSVLAQPSSGAANAQGTPPAQSGLADIIVTAQRRSESLQKAPIPVSAVSSQMLVNAGVVKAQDLTALIPALTVSTSAGPYSIFYIRGIGSFNGNSLSDSAVAFNYDGVYVSRPSSTSGFFYDLDRVEVLKGPQGTLYGRNSTGGAINVLPKRPVFGEITGDFGVEYGNYNALTVNGALNVPLGDRTAARLSFQTVNHDGYMSDGTDDENGRAVRLQLRRQLTDTLSINLSGDYFHQGGEGAGSTLIPFPFADKRIGLTDPRAGAIYASTLFFPAGNTFQALPPGNFLDNNYYGLNATIEWKTELGTLTIVPAYRRGKLDFQSTSPAFEIPQRETDQQESVEARFASNYDHKLRYLAGLYYLHESVDAIERYNNQFNISYQDFKAPLNSYAAFGRLTYALSSRFRLTGAVRYTVDDKSLDGRAYIANILCPAVLTNPASFPVANCFGGPTFSVGYAIPTEVTTAAATGIPQVIGTRGNIVTANAINVDESKTFKKLTWRAAADFDLAPRSLIYASVERGFKAGGFFFTDDDPSYQPETITAYTFGSKNRFFDNKLQMNAEWFLWKYNNQQISHITQDSLGAVVFATENVGKSTSKGVELESQYLITGTTTLSADVQYLHSKYDKFVYSVPNLGSAPVANCSATPAGSTFSLNCSGKTPPYAPRWTIDLGIAQRIPLADGAKITLQANTRYQTNILTGQEFLVAEVQKSYWMSDASVQYDAPTTRFTVALFVRNIENKVVLANSFPHPLAGSSLLVASLRPPRTYGVRAAVHF